MSFWPVFPAARNGKGIYLICVCIASSSSMSISCFFDSIHLVGLFFFFPFSPSPFSWDSSFFGSASSAACDSTTIILLRFWKCILSRLARGRIGSRLLRVAGRHGI